MTGLVADPDLIELYRDGVMDEASYSPTIYPSDQWRACLETASVAMGSAGVDGIEFHLREGVDGVWALSGITVEWTYCAADIPELVRLWHSGALSL